MRKVMLCRYSRVSLFLATAAVLPLLGGCFGPLKANIALRKEAQKNRDEIARLTSQHLADEQRMLGLERTATTVPVLPQERLSRMFTVHGLQFGRLTGGASSTQGLGHHDLVKVYVTPTDQEGQVLKASGSFTVNVFDLSEPQRPLLGSGEFSVGDAMKAWYGRAMLYCYVLEVPLKRLPNRPEVIVSVTFTDELTQRQITAEHQAKVVLPTGK